MESLALAASMRTAILKRIFALQEESGITKSVFIKLLGNALYAGHNLENYRLFRDVYEGRLVVEGFDWIIG